LEQLCTAAIRCRPFGLGFGSIVVDGNAVAALRQFDGNAATDSLGRAGDQHCFGLHPAILP